MKHGIYDENWSEKFIERVELLRKLDTQAITMPLFRERAEQIFTQMSERVMARAKKQLGDTDVTAVSFEEAIRYYVVGGTGSPVLDYLVSRVKPFCDQMRISVDAHGVAAFCCAFMILKGDLRVSYAFFTLLMRPLVSAFRIGDFGRRNGKKGGRPHNPHYHEALQHAVNVIDAHPNCTRVFLVNTVVSKLSEKYSDSPSARTVKRWLQASGIY
ncbi:hypothetical protein ACT8MX_003309 [Escherichia albertii]|uniref:hypothetical protein n=1 Tax=Escherichia albertii TaxID=208962 RepID=UPI0011EA046C|nr:hypothetical protein [Escherichia albertii]